MAGVGAIAALAWAAGAVNALGYIVVGDVFTSHVSGDASAVVVALIAGGGGDTVRRILVVAAFFGGALFGALLIERHRSHSAAGTLWCETALLCLAAWPSRQTPVVIDYRLISVAAAMGIQNIALAGSAMSAHTTHITGPLTDFAGVVVRKLVGRRELSRDRSHGLLVYGGRVAAFVVGVATGAGLARFGSTALLVPAAAIASIAVVMWRAAPAQP
ncbi:MAG TPA: YoaK family protein [Vicinamibacterales bacterium]|nr:YoaK family protein [Vicinamibacterales bacterium]